jgi:hypothetical protein
MSDEQLAATVERFRERSSPSFDLAAESAEDETATDTSIEVDPQLELAFEKIQEMLGHRN